MKKLLVAFIILAGVAGVSAENGENFEKAAERELAKRESVLQKLSTEIDTYVREMPADSFISGKEMTKLIKMVENFNKTKKKFDKELEFYGKETKTSLCPSYTLLCNTFRKEPNLRYYGDSPDQKIKRFFVEITGYDVQVGRAPNWTGRVLGGLIMGLIGIIFIGGLCALLNINNETVVFLIFGSTFMIIYALFLFL